MRRGRKWKHLGWEQRKRQRSRMYRQEKDLTGFCGGRENYTGKTWVLSLYWGEEPNQRESLKIYEVQSRSLENFGRSNRIG